MRIVCTIAAKVESAPAGETQYIFHITPRFGWGAVEYEEGPGFAIRVLESVFHHYNVGDELIFIHPETIEQ